MGSYDAPFAGCVGVLHMGAVMGRPGANKETPQEVYDGSFTDVAHVWDSAVKAGTVKRFVQASSMAAVGHGPPDDYEGDPRYYMRDHVFTEDDWTGQADGSQDPAPVRQSHPLASADNVPLERPNAERRAGAGADPYGPQHRLRRGQEGGGARPVQGRGGCQLRGVCDPPDARARAAAGGEQR